MVDYKKELTRLFKKYNPEKVKDVDALLTKFAGREEELIATVHAKYGAPASEEKSNRKPKIILLLAFVMAVLALGSWYAAREGMFDFGEKEEETKTELADGDNLQNGAMDESEEELLSATELALEKDVEQTTERDGMRTDKSGATSAPPMEYGVQIGLYSVADNAEVRKMLGDAQIDLNILPTETGKYMYVVGADTELGQARTRRDQLRKGAFQDAFVVGLRKGKRVDIFKD